MKKIYVAFGALLLLFSLSGCHAEMDYSDTQFCLDTYCTIRAGGEDAETAVAEAFALLYQIQGAVDYYDENSTVSKINAATAGTPIPLDTHTYTILNTALQVSEASGGAFSVTIAPVKALWNFDEEPHHVPSADELQNALSFVGDANLSLDDQQRTLTKTHDAVSIDLGGAAKGYAADCLLEFLQSRNISYAVIDLGGNVKVWGKNPASSDGLWSVGIQQPFGSKGELSQTLQIAEGSVVTSGTYQRNFTENGILYHHILNPATGYPADNGHDSATIVADSSLLADCLSTACMVLPEENAEALAAQFGVQLYFHDR